MSAVHFHQRSSQRTGLHGLLSGVASASESAVRGMMGSTTASPASIRLLRCLLVSALLVLGSVSAMGGAEAGELVSAGESPLYMHSGKGTRYRGDVEELIARVRAGARPRLLITGWHGDMVVSCESPQVTDDGTGVRCEVQVPCNTMDPNVPSHHQHMYSIDTRTGADGSVLKPATGPNSGPNGWQLDGTEPRPVRIQWFIDSN